jgi:hypothetical protein
MLGDGLTVLKVKLDACVSRLERRIAGERYRLASTIIYVENEPFDVRTYFRDVGHKDIAHTTIVASFAFGIVQRGTTTKISLPSNSRKGASYWCLHFYRS